MSLLGTLNTAKTALAANQVALQTVGNNIANAGNADYNRQVTRMVATKPQEIRRGLFVGTGIDVQSVERQINESIEQRLRASISDFQGNAASSQWLTRVEAVYNELSDADISTGMSTFFNAWSELANKPQDTGLRQVVLQEGGNLTQQFQTVRNQLNGLRKDLSDQVKSDTARADDLSKQIAGLNKSIAINEGGAGMANTLRDQRDAILKQLSELINVNTSAGDNGMVNVYIGSEPLVMGSQSRGLSVHTQPDTATDSVKQTVVFKNGDGSVHFSSGTLGAVVDAKQTLDESVRSLDDLAGAMIFELNRIHSSGQGLAGVNRVTSEHSVADADAALNDAEATKLGFTPTNGSFVVHVKDKASGAVTSTLIQVDLDGAGTQTSLNSLAASIDGVDDLTATVNAGRLTIRTDSDAVEVSFSQDSSGLLAAIGVGGFFSGSDASDIAIRSELEIDPRLLAAARNGQRADNQTAKAIAALQTQSLSALGGRNLDEAYQAQVNTVAAKVEGARKDAEAASVVRDTLQTQHDAISGVSLDEEAINLMKYQRAYQAASRVIAATDEMMQTLLSLV